MTGHRLGDDSRPGEAERGRRRSHVDMSNDARVQLLLFQQFLMLFLLIAHHGRDGARGSRDRRREAGAHAGAAARDACHHIRAADGQGARVRCCRRSRSHSLGLALYFGGIAVARRAGRRQRPWRRHARRCCCSCWSRPRPRSSSLQSAIIISSRVNDARTAQQFGVFIIIPLTGAAGRAVHGRDLAVAPRR